jgi:hypothetical protein
MQIQLDIELQPKQRQLLNLVDNSPFRIIGYGGSRGGAKSHGVRDIMLIRRLKYAGTKGLILRRHYHELLDNHIIPFFSKYPQLYKFYNKSEKTLYLPNGSIIRFFHMQYEMDVYKMQGPEYDDIDVDEATHFTQPMLEYLFTINRASNPNITRKMIWTMNPGNVGHLYVKRVLIDREYESNEDPNDFYFLPAKVYDNVVWSLRALAEQGLTPKDYYSWTDEQRRDFCYKYADYAKDLQKLPYDQMMAWLEGDWDIFGGRFFKLFDKKKMIIPPFKIPRDWKLFGHLDPGWESPCSFGISAYDYEGRRYRVDTYYEAGLTPLQHAERILDFIRECPWTQDDTLVNLPYGQRGRMPVIIPAGRDAFAKRDRLAIIAHDVTWQDVFEAKGIYLEPANTSRKIGWGAVKDLMAEEKYYVFGKQEIDKYGNEILKSGNNKPVIDFYSSIISDPKDVDDIYGKGNDESIEDHSGDEDRYGVMAGDSPKQRKDATEPRTGMREAAKMIKKKKKGLADF